MNVKNFLTKDFTKEIPVDHHLADVENLVESLMSFHKRRESTYKMSFAKRGEVGIWMNLARKYDRMDGLMEKIVAGDESIRLTLIDTLVDLALYALKWLAIIIAYDYKSWESWTEENGVGYSDASEDEEKEELENYILKNA